MQYNTMHKQLTTTPTITPAPAALPTFAFNGYKPSRMSESRMLLQTKWDLLHFAWQSNFCEDKTAKW